MSFLQNDIAKLQKSAINFLYIFVSANAVGLSSEIMRKRKEQLEELGKIYSYNEGYTMKQLIEIVQNSIIYRYGKTPQQMLQEIYEASAPRQQGAAGIGAGEITDAQAAMQVKNITTVVNDGGTKVKKNFWSDVQTVLEWLLAFIQKIFGTFRNPNSYSPVSDDYTYGKRPTVPPGYDNQNFNKAGMDWMPIVAAGGIVLYLASGNMKGKGKGKRKKKDE